MQPLTPRKIAFKKLEELREAGCSDTQILEDILGNQLSGSEAAAVMTSIAEEVEELLGLGWDPANS